MIFKVIPGWAKAPESNAFTNAWATLVNALSGAWGDIDFVIIGTQKTSTTVASAHVIQGKYTSNFTTTLEGTQTINLPYDSDGYAFVSVRKISGNLVTELDEYIVSAGQRSISIDLGTGTSIINLSGTARSI